MTSHRQVLRMDAEARRRTELQASIHRLVASLDRRSPLRKVWDAVKLWVLMLLAGLAYLFFFLLALLPYALCAALLWWVLRASGVL